MPSVAESVQIMTIGMLLVFGVTLALSSNLEFALAVAGLFLLSKIANSLRDIALYQRLQTLAAVDPERIK